MAREINQERETTRLIAQSGYDWESRKDGKCGYPDRLVLLGKHRHCWIEHKTEKGRLTPAQKRVFPRLEARGDFIIYGKGLTPEGIVDRVWRFYFDEKMDQ